MEPATVNIPKDVLDPIISAHITKAVVEALGNSGHTLVEQAVSAMLLLKVDDSGNRSRYNNRDDKSWIEWAIADAVQKVAKEAITEYFTSNESVVKKAIVKELNKTNSPMAKALAEGLVTGAAKVLQDCWRMNVTFQMDK